MAFFDSQQFWLFPSWNTVFILKTILLVFTCGNCFLQAFICTTNKFLWGFIYLPNKESFIEVSCKNLNSASYHSNELKLYWERRLPWHPFRYTVTSTFTMSPSSKRLKHYVHCQKRVHFKITKHRTTYLESGIPWQITSFTDLQMHHTK